MEQIKLIILTYLNVSNETVNKILRTTKWRIFGAVKRPLEENNFMSPLRKVVC